MSKDPLSEARTLSHHHVVVCVASNPDLLTQFRSYTALLPCRIHTTESPDEALALLDASRVSLILAEPHLKEMSGSQLLREAARRSPMTARVLLGPYRENADRLPSDEETTAHGIIGTWDGPSLQRTIIAILKWQEERLRLSTETTATGAFSGVPSDGDRGRKEPAPEREEEGVTPPPPRKNPRRP